MLCSQEEGVKVFVLLYKEIKVALNILSDYSKQILMSHCPENIKVIISTIRSCLAFVTLVLFFILYFFCFFCYSLASFLVLYLSACAHVCISSFVRSFMHVCLFVHVCICQYACVCMCVCLAVSACVSVCLSVSTFVCLRVGFFYVRLFAH